MLAEEGLKIGSFRFPTIRNRFIRTRSLRRPAFLSFVILRGARERTGRGRGGGSLMSCLPATRAATRATCPVQTRGPTTTALRTESGSSAHTRRYGAKSGSLPWPIAPPLACCFPQSIDGLPLLRRRPVDQELHHEGASGAGLGVVAPSFRCCDPCYEARRSELLIVPSHAVVAARCDECQHWFNPREMTELRMGGKWSAYSGTCTLCLE
jgi:hypothetical protein